MKNKKPKKKLLPWMFVGFSLMVLAGGVIVLNNSPQTDNRAVTGTPSFQVDTEEIELGEIDVTGDYPAEFTVTNIGDAPLELSKVQTSCMCTLAEIIIGEEKSPEFNMEMHNSLGAKKWKGTINPGETATVRMIYKPHLMPVIGSVARTVKFVTNDPNNPRVELGIHATVK